MCVGDTPCYSILRYEIGEASLRALSKLCSERDSVLKDIVEYYGLVLSYTVLLCWCWGPT